MRSLRYTASHSTKTPSYPLGVFVGSAMYIGDFIIASWLQKSSSTRVLMQNDLLRVSVGLMCQFHEKRVQHLPPSAVLSWSHVLAMIGIVPMRW